MHNRLALVIVSVLTLIMTCLATLPANAATYAWCSSDPQGTWQPGFGRWFIQNDAWNGDHGPQRICANSYHYWRVVSKQPNLGGAVQTYPNSQKNFGAVAGLPNAPFNSFRAINSRFSIGVPTAPGLSFNAAYDMWYGHDWDHLTAEVMIWFYTVNVDMGGSKYLGKAYIYGQTFNVYRYDGSPPEYVFRLNHNVKSGTAHIQSATQWLVNHGYMKASTQIVAIPFGFEIRSTNNVNRWFGLNSLDLYTQRK